MLLLICKQNYNKQTKTYNQHVTIIITYIYYYSVIKPNLAILFNALFNFIFLTIIKLID